MIDPESVYNEEQIVESKPAKSKTKAVPESPPEPVKVLDEYGLCPDDFPTPKAYFNAKQEKYLNERVPYILPKDSMNYNGDVTVQINGKIWLIQRGQRVNLPRQVVEQLEHQERMNMSAMAMSDRMASRNLSQL